MRYLFDTNAVIYFLRGIGRFPTLTQEDEVLISSITRLELLSGPMSDYEGEPLLQFLSSVREREVTREIIDQAIVVRKDRNVKVPDAIIIGTALSEQATLVSADKEMLRKIGRIPSFDPLLEE